MNEKKKKKKKKKNHTHQRKTLKGSRHQIGQPPFRNDPSTKQTEEKDS